MSPFDTAVNALITCIGDIHGDVSYDRLRVDCRKAVQDAFDTLRAKYNKIGPVSIDGDNANTERRGENE